MFSCRAGVVPLHSRLRTDPGLVLVARMPATSTRWPRSAVALSRRGRCCIPTVPQIQYGENRRETSGPLREQPMNLPVFYSPAYVSAARPFDTTRKAKWVADSLRTCPIAGVELIEP